MAHRFQDYVIDSIRGMEVFDPKKIAIGIMWTRINEYLANIGKHKETLYFIDFLDKLDDFRYFWKFQPKEDEDGYMAIIIQRDDICPYGLNIHDSNCTKLHTVTSNNTICKLQCNLADYLTRNINSRHGYCNKIQVHKSAMKKKDKKLAERRLKESDDDSKH